MLHAIRCIECGRLFEAERRNREICDQACKQARWRRLKGSRDAVTIDAAAAALRQIGAPGLSDLIDAMTAEATRLRKAGAR